MFPTQLQLFSIFAYWCRRPTYPTPHCFLRSRVAKCRCMLHPRIPSLREIQEMQELNNDSEQRMRIPKKALQKATKRSQVHPHCKPAEPTHERLMKGFSKLRTHLSIHLAPCGLCFLNCSSPPSQCSCCCCCCLGVATQTLHDAEVAAPVTSVSVADAGDSARGSWNGLRGEARVAPPVRRFPVKRVLR